mgnify:CR=1 FL=1
MGSRGLQEGFKSVCVCALRTCSDSKSSRRCLAVPSAVTAAESRERSDAASARRAERVPPPDPGSPPEGVWKRGSTGRCAGEGAAGGAAAAAARGGAAGRRRWPTALHGCTVYCTRLLATPAPACLRAFDHDRLAMLCLFWSVWGCHFDHFEVVLEHLGVPSTNH